MGILILSLVLSIMLGLITWLVIGDQMPPKSKYKWESRSNIFIYIALLVVPIYLLIFFLSWLPE